MNYNKLLDEFLGALRVGMLVAIVGLGAISLVGAGMVVGMTQAEKIRKDVGRFDRTVDAPIVVSRIAPGYTIVTIAPDIRAPSEYIELYYVLMTANLGDTVQLNISSPGGRVDTMVSIAGMMHSSPAHVIANVTGPAYSAAAMITLAADEVRMAQGAFLMYHDIQVGDISGERGRIVEALTTYKRIVEEFFVAYNTKGILTQEEIDGLFDGNEVYLTKGDVDARIKAHKEKSKERAVPQRNPTGDSDVGRSGILVGDIRPDNILPTVRYAH